MPRATFAHLLPCLLAFAAPTGAVIGGGGSPLTDCFVVLDGVAATADRRVECADGSDCDADGSRDAVCTFDVRVCVNAYRPRDPECAPRRRVESLTVYGAQLSLPRLPSLYFRCGEPTRLVVPLRRKSSGRVSTGRLKIKMVATRLGKPKKDKDSMRFYCLPNPCPDTEGPSVLTLTVGAHGSDVDLGWSGAGHNLPAPDGTFPYCLSGCAGEGQTCSGNVNPSYASDGLGLPPVPVRAAGTPLCLQPHLTLPSEIRASATTGSVDGIGRLEAAAWVTAPTALCPRCVDPFNGGIEGGTTCEGGPRQGQPCAVAGLFWVPDADGNPLYPVSRDCPPATDLLAARVAADLPFTTATSTLAQCSGADGTPLPDDLCDAAGCGGACACAPDDPTLCKAMTGGVHQACCVSDSSRACFPAGAPVTRVGVPVPLPQPPPETPDVIPSASGALVATACLAAEPEGTVPPTGLDGPAAVVMPVSALWLP